MIIPILLTVFIPTLITVIIAIIIMHPSKERKLHNMKYCSKCGIPMKDDDNFCPACGTPTVATFSNQTQSYNQAPYNPAYNPYSPYVDKNSVGLNILSFCFPIVGLILYLVNKDKKPTEAKGCGKWALISFCINLVLYPILFVIGL